MSTIKSSDEHLTLNADGSSKDIKFQANGVEKASISSAGVMTATSFSGSGASLTGIADATKVPLAGGTMTGNLIVGSVTDPTISLLSNANDNATSGRLKFREGDGTNGFDLRYNGSANQAVIDTTDVSNALTIDRTTGNVGIGAAPISQGQLSVTQTNGGQWACKMVHTSTDAPMLLLQNAMNSGSFGNAHIEFLINNGTTVGTIKCSNSATQYNTSSDYRLKENVDYTWDATTRLKQLKPARFNFIVDNTKTVDGFIAHEVSSVVPEAISGEKDAVDDDGNAVHQGIDQSKLVPLLVKTIQELEARITALEA